LSKGADPWIKADKQSTPLHVCAERNFFEIAKMIIYHDYEKNKDLVYEQTEKDEFDDETEMTALHVATEWNSMEIVELLWDVGGEKLVNIKNAGGANAVDFAYQENQEEIYAYLSEKMGLKTPGWIFCSIF
jgi:ankyrin repeat protein